MAVGYAYAHLDDFHLAEDTAQEAFLEAHACLPTLRKAAAFPTWLRRIVFKQCDRFTRRGRFSLVMLDDEIPSDLKSPADALAQGDQKDLLIGLMGSSQEVEDIQKRIMAELGKPRPKLSKRYLSGRRN